MSILANPVDMIEQGAPRIIHTDEELALYSDALFELTAKEKPTEVELETIDLLSLLIETYQAQHSRLPEVEPIDVLRFLMEHNGVQQKDLIPELGSKALVSMILTGKRSMTVQHIRALAEKFKVPVGVFI